MQVIKIYKFLEILWFLFCGYTIFILLLKKAFEIDFTDERKTPSYNMWFSQYFSSIPYLTVLLCITKKNYSISIYMLDLRTYIFFLNVFNFFLFIFRFDYLIFNINVCKSICTTNIHTQYSYTMYVYMNVCMYIQYVHHFIFSFRTCIHMYIYINVYVLYIQCIGMYMHYSF